MHIKPFLSLLTKYPTWFVGILWSLISGIIFSIYLKDCALAGDSAINLSTLTNGLPRHISLYPLLRYLTQDMDVLAINRLGCMFASLIVGMLCALITYWTNWFELENPWDSQNIEKRSERSNLGLVVGMVTGVLFMSSLGWLLGSVHFSYDLWQLLGCVLLLLGFTCYTYFRSYFSLGCFGLLCGLLVFEMVWVVALIPVLFIIAGLFCCRLREQSVPNSAGLWLLCAIFGASGYLFGSNLVVEAQDFSLWTTMIAALRFQLGELFRALPSAWLSTFCFGSMLGLVSILCGFFASKRHSYGPRFVLMILLVPLYAIVLCKFPISPNVLALERLTFPLATICWQVLGLAMLIVGWWMYLRQNKVQKNDISSEENLRQEKIKLYAQTSAYVIFPALVILVLFYGISNWKSFLTLDRDLPDRYADEVISQMGDRAFLLGAPWADPHLALAIQRHNKSIVLLRPYSYHSLHERDHILKTIKESPNLSSLDLQRAIDLLDYNYLIFIHDFFSSDAYIATISATLNNVDVWNDRTHTLIPAGCIFTAIESDTPPPTVDQLLNRHQSLWQTWTPQLTSREGYDYNKNVRRQLATHFSLLANNFGVYLSDQGHFQSAISAYEAAYTFQPKNISTLLNSYELIVKENVKTNMAKTFKSALDKLLYDQRHSTKKHLFDRTEYIFGKIRNSELFAQMGLVRAMQVAPDALLRNLYATETAHTEQDSNQDTVQAMIALIQDQKGNKDLAKQAYAKALALNPANILATQGLIHILLSEGRIDEVKKVLDQAVAAGADTTIFGIQWTLYYLAKNDTQTAMKHISDYTAHHPDNVQAWSLLGQLYLQTGDLDKCKTQVMVRLRRLATGENRYYINLMQGHIALAEQKTNALQVARDQYKEALNFIPNALGLANTVLNLDIQLNNVRDTEIDAVLLLRKDPMHPLANMIVGTRRLSAGDPETAVRYFERAADIKDPPPYFLNNYAETLLYLNRAQEAALISKRAVDLAPDQFYTWGTYALALAQCDQTQEAIEALTKARALPGGDNPQLYLVDAWIARNQEDKDAMRTAIEAWREHLDSTTNQLEERTIKKLTTK